MRILLVEDDKPLAQAVMAYLHNKQFSVDWAEDLPQARAFVSVTSYSAVLLDLNLPSGEGLQLLPAIAAARFDPPWVRDLARDHSAGEEVVRQLLKKLSRQGLLFQVVKDLFYAPARMDELAALTTDIAAQTRNGEVEASAFRDATGLGRKRAIQILEFFDRIGYTRRVRDAHLLRPDVQWKSATH